MTEEDAKKKWCPMVRMDMSTIYGPEFVRSMPVNKAYLSPMQVWEGAKCIGAACMMWRIQVYSSVQRLPDPHIEGYCGLAGKPE